MSSSAISNISSPSVELVKLFVMGETAQRPSHLRVAHENCVARRVDILSDSRSSVDGSLDILDQYVVIRIPASMPYGGTVGSGANGGHLHGSRSKITEMDFYYWDTAQIVEATGGVKAL
jgi:hypothetical protein